MDPLAKTEEITTVDKFEKDQVYKYVHGEAITYVPEGKT
jgi:hypothetical protein